MSAEKLLPCSECSCEEPDYSKHKPVHFWRYRVMCPNCGLTISGHEKQKVFNKWNTRA